MKAPRDETRRRDRAIDGVVGWFVDLTKKRSKIEPWGEYSPFLGAAGCAKLRKFRRVSGIPKSPHCNSAARPMEEREPDAQKFINSIAQDADAERRLALRGR
jgi:hypothetical protein